MSMECQGGAQLAALPQRPARRPPQLSGAAGGFPELLLRPAGLYL